MCGAGRHMIDGADLAAEPLRGPCGLVSFDDWGRTLGGRLRVEDAVAEHQKVDAEDHYHGRQIYELGGDAQRLRQQRGGRSGHAVLRAGEDKIATSLAVPRQRELL